MQKIVDQLEKRITVIKASLQGIGPMRPGTLTQQYKNPKEKTGGYYQISYTLHMKSRTEYVRPPFVRQIQKEVTEYKRYRDLIERWVDLSIELSKLKIKLALAQEKG